MGKLTSGRWNRILSGGLLAAALVVTTEGAHAATAKSCESLFGTKLEGSKEPTIPVPNTRVRVRKATPVASGPTIEIPADASTTLRGKPTTPEKLKEQIAVLSGFEELNEPEGLSTVRGERRSLWDFLNPDPSKNIAMHSPLTIMNAPQRMLALIYTEGTEQVRLQLSNEPVTVYPFFSGGRKVTNYKRLVGGEKAVQTLISNLKAQAEGDRAASSLPLLVGSQGTGKSETLNLMAIAAQNLTSQVDPKFANYTFTWTNLGEIKSLHRFLTAINTDGKVTYADVEAPLGDSPFVLLPEGVQKLILRDAAPYASAMIDGMQPTPWLDLDPISSFIRNEILQDAAAKLGRQPNAKEIVGILANHVVVKRQIIGQRYNKMPLIDSQPEDIDTNALFAMPNMMVRHGSGEGPTHEMAYYYSGKMFQAHGNAVLLDEYFRNPKTLRDMLLGVFESRQVSIGGMRTVPFNAVMIAATNTANLDEVRATPGGAAAVDRFKREALRWSLYPNEIVKLMLSGKQAQLKQQRLAETETAGALEPADIDELIPRVQGTEKITTSDYRYILYYGQGKNRVFIAPHTLLMMAEILSATRMELDPNKVAKEMGPKGGKFIGSNLQRNPIDRLKLYEGTKSATADEILHLLDASILMKEGETGISARDAGRWFSDALDMAATKQYGYTLTPGVALKAFRKTVREAGVAPSTAERLRWEALAQEVVTQMLIPRLGKDISSSLANGDHVVRSAYWEILDEMAVVNDTPGTTTYVTASGQARKIDVERLEEIHKIYQKINGRPLSLAQISLFHTRQIPVSARNDSENIPDEALMEAIGRYYAELNSRVAGFNAIVNYERTRTGNDEVASVHSSLVEAMRKIGYNDVSMHDALMIVDEHRGQTEAPVQ